MARRFPHQVEGGTSGDFWVNLPDVYSGIGTDLGIRKLAGAAPAGVNEIPIREAVSTGKMRRIHITYVRANVRRVAKLFVASDRADTARAGLGVDAGGENGKTITLPTGSFKILTAYFPTQRRLG
jgi:hypothetical protein